MSEKHVLEGRPALWQELAHGVQVVDIQGLLWTCGEALDVRGAGAEEFHMGDPSSVSLKALPGHS